MSCVQEPHQGGADLPPQGFSCSSQLSIISPLPLSSAALDSGYDTGVVSGALLVIGRDFGGELLSTFQEEAIVSSALVGALIGSLAAGRLADWWGRKRVIVLAAVLFTLGALEQAAATVYRELLLGRVVVGIGVGLASMVRGDEEIHLTQLTIRPRSFPSSSPSSPQPSSVAVSSVLS